jgi:hypothetical protein
MVIISGFYPGIIVNYVSFSFLLILLNLFFSFIVFFFFSFMCFFNFG